MIEFVVLLPVFVSLTLAVLGFKKIFDRKMNATTILASNLQLRAQLDNDGSIEQDPPCSADYSEKITHPWLMIRELNVSCIDKIALPFDDRSLKMCADYVVIKDARFDKAALHASVYGMALLDKYSQIQGLAMDLLSLW